MKNDLLLIVLSLFFITGCNENRAFYEKRIENIKSYDFELVQDNILSFPFDSVSGYDLKSLQIFYDDLDKKFVYFNSKRNTIYFYDFTLQKHSFSISLAEEGVNGVGPNVNGIFVHSLDSIYVFSDYAISRVNADAEVLERVRFDRMGAIDFGFTLEAGTKQNPYIYRDELYVVISSELDPFLIESFGVVNQVLLSVNLKTGGTTSHFDFPENYKEYVYPPNYSNIYFTFNEEKELFVFSFPADSRLHLDSFENQRVVVDAESRFFKEIDPMIDDYMREDFMTYTKHYLTNFSYGPIYFDKYRNIYYRFVEHPITEVDYEDRNWLKTCSVILMDKDFNVIGESKLSKSVDKVGIVDDLGLLIPMRCPDDSEDFLCIGVYSVVGNIN